MMISWERLFSLSFSLSAFFFLRVPLGPTRNGQKEEGGGRCVLCFQLVEEVEKRMLLIIHVWIIRVPTVSSLVLVLMLVVLVVVVMMMVV